MTQPLQMKRPEGEAAKHYEEALRLEREAAELVMHGLTPDKLEDAERLRNLARAAWKRFQEQA